MNTVIIIVLAIAGVWLVFSLLGRAKTKQSLEHIEMFVRNKIREGYEGNSPARAAKENVMNTWSEYGNKGANAQAANILGGEDKTVGLVSAMAEKILNSKEELDKTLKGAFRGSSVDILRSIIQDEDRDKDTISPLSIFEKTFFIQLILKQENIDEVMNGQVDGDGSVDITDSPQYILVESLDFLYVFMMNLEFRNDHIKRASSKGINLSNYRLAPDYLMQLGEYHVSALGLSPSQLDEVRDLWQNQIDDPNYNRTDTPEDAMLYWGECVIRPLQVMSLMELGQSKGVLNDDEFRKDVGISLSVNRTLIAKYLDMRSAVN